MRKTHFRFLLIVVSIAVASIFYISNSKISDSEERCKFYSCLGSIISINMSIDKNNTSRIYCINRYPTAFNSIYQKLPIVTLADIKVKSGDYNYALRVPVRYRNDNKFREALLILQYPKHYFDTNDFQMLGDQTIAGSHYRAIRAAYNRDVIKGVRTLQLEYVDCEYGPGPKCETCLSADVVDRELVVVHVE